MKNRLLFLCVFCSFLSFSQINIKGTVYIGKTPIEGAAVYLNNSMLGTTTNANGTFTLPVKEGQYELIISYLGYKKIAYKLNTSTYKKPLVFTLVEEENVLDEVIVKKIVYDDKWKYNLATFKREFIGITKFSKNCKILNPEVLFFDFDASKNLLEAYARKPLIIKNKDLGYLITYELEHFVINKKFITYLGYSRYKEFKGGKRKQKRWKKNRKIAYNGSPVHFYKSVINDTFTKEGFIVNQFKRVPNSKRPTDNEIEKARQFIRLNKKFIVDFSKKIDTPKTALDSALVILRKSRLPKFRDYLYKSKLKKEDILSTNNNIHYLIFKDNLSIIYTKEKEEEGYLLRNSFRKKRATGVQSSALVPLKKPLILDKSGVLINPLSVLYEGYWSYEKFANSLPLDYEPKD